MYTSIQRRNERNLLIIAPIQKSRRDNKIFYKYDGTYMIK